MQGPGSVLFRLEKFLKRTEIAYVIAVENVMKSFYIELTSAEIYAILVLCFSSESHVPIIMRKSYYHTLLNFEVSK